MLSRPVYEILPYAYLAAGCVGLVALDLGPAQLFAGLLYLAGAFVWVMRSNYRRADLRRNGKWQRSSDVSRVRVPNRVYELFPFVILGLAVWLLSFADTPFKAVPALMLIGYSAWVIVRRIHYRQHGWVKLQQKPIEF